MDNFSDRIAKLSPAKRALFEIALKEKDLGGPLEGSIPRARMAGPAPLSFAQQRLWFLSQLEPDSSAYHQPNAVRLSGSLNIEALKKAIDGIVCRHEVLGTFFTLVDGGSPVQSVRRNRSVDLPLIDLSSVPDDERDEAVQRIITEISERRFDLSNDMMIRAALLRLAPYEHVLLLVTHHIATDGWSGGILWSEIAALYAAFSSGEPNPLPDLPVQYADYAVWQRNYLQGEILERQLSYWMKQLSGVPTLELPVDRPRPSVQSFRRARQTFAVPKSLVAKLKTLGHAQGATLFMTLLAGFQTLLHRYTGQEDIAVGSPIANRTRPEIEGLIGFFVNTLALRTDLSGNPSFTELLTRVRGSALGAYEHQDLPFEKLVEEINPERRLGQTPLFQVMFVLQNTPRRPVEIPGLELSPVKTNRQTAKFDLTLSMTESADSLKGALDYNTDLFEEATIRRMACHFQTLLRDIAAHPDRRISELSLLTEAERTRLLVDWNDTRRDYPKDKCLHELFEAQVERTPDSVAVVFDDVQLTYRELNMGANRLAHHLQKLGVGPEVLIGICLERSVELVVGLLAVLKAGGAYVPLDPTHPKERLAFLLEDSVVSVLLTEQKLLDRLPEHSARIVCMDKKLAQESESNPDCPVREDNCAYVIYTSGSTGNPKGAVIEHRSLVNYLRWFNESPMAEGLESLPAITSATFDASLKQLFAPLLRGNPVWILSSDMISEPAALLKTLSTRTSAGLNCVPSLWESVIKAFEADHALDTEKNLAFLYLGGETPNRHLIDKTLAVYPHIKIWNLYGPTEATANATVARISPGTPVTLGRPIANAQIYILDRSLNPVPIGVPGQLHIGGAGLARGYLNRPELTAEKFIPNPFSDVPGARLYKTGDLARYLADGNIEFLGRLDRQVKIHGFRIELEEIEAAFRQHPDVYESVVLARDDETAAQRGNDNLKSKTRTELSRSIENPKLDKRLVAYLVSRQEPAPTTAELRSFLKDKLPGYMLPSAFVFLKSLPLTASGKVNRQALPAPDPMRPELEGAFVPPRTPTESIIANIWRELLGVDRVGVHDDFFDLGGHSLLAVRLFARIENELGKKPPLSSLFERATVEHLASLLAEPRPSSGSSSLVAIQPHGSKPPFFCVHEFFGDVLCYSNLARHLGDDQPFYALQARGLDGSEEPFTDIKAMAAYYVKEIRTVQPKGPYALGGLCIGGVVAFEMALQLRAQGEEVALVGLLDSGINSKRGRRARQWSFLRNLPRDLPSWLTGSFQLNRSQWLSLINLKFRMLKARLTALSHSSGGASQQDPASKRIKEMGDLFGFSEQHRSVARAQSQALRHYKPQVYPGRLTLFRARMQPLFSSHDPEKGWGRLAAEGLDIRLVPGNHLGMLQEPHVRVLAEQLRACMNTARTEAERTRLPA